MKNKTSYYETGFGHGLLFAIGFVTAMVVCSLVPIKILENVFAWFGVTSNIKAFLQNEKFLFPFFSTLGATLTVLTFQFVQRSVSEKKKKIFAISYMYDVCYLIYVANMILKQNTILPHIEAIERVFQGETNILQVLFDSGDFKILTENSPDFRLLPEEHKMLVGCDNIRLIQAFEAVIYLYGQKSKSEKLNNHVNEYLLSNSNFSKFSGPEQIEILKTYLDNLVSVKYENDRAIWFVLFSVLPELKQYSKSLQFFGFNRKSIKTTQENIALKIQEYKELLPENDLMSKKKKSGIQSAL